MIAEAAKELFALFNVACGALVFVLLILYLLGQRQRRAAVVLTLLSVILLCLLNGLAVYLLF